MEDFLKAAIPKIPTLAGIKFTSINMFDLGRCLVLDKERIQVLFGGDEVSTLQVQRYVRITDLSSTSMSRPSRPYPIVGPDSLMNIYEPLHRLTILCLCGVLCIFFLYFWASPNVISKTSLSRALNHQNKQEQKA